MTGIRNWNIVMCHMGVTMIIVWDHIVSARVVIQPERAPTCNETILTTVFVTIKCILILIGPIEFTAISYCQFCFMILICADKFMLIYHVNDDTANSLKRVPITPRWLIRYLVFENVLRISGQRVINLPTSENGAFRIMYKFAMFIRCHIYIVYILHIFTYKWYRVCIACYLINSTVCTIGCRYNSLHYNMIFHTAE